MLGYLELVSCSPCLLSVHSLGRLIPHYVFYSIVLQRFQHWSLSWTLDLKSLFIITTWMFNILAKFSVSRTVLLSLLPLKINRHKICFVSSPCFTLQRIRHMINLTAPEKTLEDLRRHYLFLFILLHLSSKLTSFFFFFQVCLWSVI